LVYIRRSIWKREGKPRRKEGRLLQGELGDSDMFLVPEYAPSV
jgi:hypothetical protein